MRLSHLLITTLIIYSNLAFTETISVMSYNVENLFDTVHDEGRDDFTYLPKRVKDNSEYIQKHCKSLSKPYYIESCLNLDWNKNLLFKKLTSIARVIKTVNFGSGADVVVLQEVENQNVVNILMNRELRKLGYKYSVVLEGEDSRGIDNAVISKYPISKSKIHKIDLRGIAKKTRGILEVKIIIGYKNLTILANHWPSQGNPTAARLKAARTLRTVARNLSSDLILALGDFNTVEPRDNPNPLKTITEKDFYNAQEIAIKLGTTVAEGSHWYAGHWGSLDKMYVYKQSSVNSVALFNSFEIIKKDFMLADKKWTDFETGVTKVYKDVPYRFNHSTGEGYSDHLPLFMKFYL